MSRSAPIVAADEIGAPAGAATTPRARPAVRATASPAVRTASRGWIWPVAIVALLAGSAGANIGFMLIASRDASFAVEPDYYRKAVNWDRTMEQQRVNGALGWTAAAALERTGRGQARLAVRLLDRTGAPVDGASVEVEGFASARAGNRLAARLAATGDGQYAAALPAGRPGLWEIRLRATRGGDVFTRTMTAELAP
jgi:nitrogen fixation protein FixH